ncbi:MAG TPA: kelch repeat-containing protein, partial [Candidatus Limnocylindrales bacterium]|nr:kelch repeat-containing protein [Candidatus Limnocylindrales bacterium]
VVVALRDGRVLIAGGAQPGHFAEVFDPATGRSTPTAPPPTEVAEPRMALLRDGRVLIVGWVYRDQASSVAGQSVGLVFDPRSDAYTSTGPMTEPHFTPTLVTLSDGRVLVTGGVANQASAELRTAEIFDPATGRYAPTGSMTSARIGHAMTLLSDGHVLVVGCPAGDNSCLGTWAADVYDPASGTFTPTSGQLRSRSSPAALLLPDGRVLTFGLRQQDGLRFGRHGIDTISASFFDPRDGTFTAAPALPHTISTAALLPDGLVSVTGTWGLSDGSTSAAGTTDFWFGLYDPLTGETRTSLDPLTGQAGLAGDTNEAYSAAAVLPDGRVVLVGAVDSQAAVVPANSISIFK